jgi:RIO kinase 2
MNSQDFRVMEATEKGMKNHSLVPLPLITSIANLRHGGTNKIISSLLRDKLLSHERRKNGYDGYRLTNAGYDILALHNLKSRGYVAAFGQRIGTGKESDVYLAADPDGRQIVLKLHRLGRTSFRNVRKKRDYLGKAASQAHSWLFLSRVSALKEYAFMKSLYDVQYPTPTPIAHNRHIVCMGLVRGLPLYQIFPKQLSVHQAADIYEQAIGLAARLAQHGLVHCDLNEFNLLVDLSGVQSLATTSEDPYVRHSGHTVAPREESAGHLSKPAWEQSLEAGDNIAEALPEPVARLEDGEAKPIVTLIDFPQMISTKHPNAEEMYERDLGCLRRFFELKLLCTIPDELAEETAWDSLVHSSDNKVIDADRRLDEELRASGYSADMKVGLELYYFEESSNPITTTVDEGSGEEEEEEEDDEKESPDTLIETNIPDAAPDTPDANLPSDPTSTTKDTETETDHFELNSDDGLEVGSQTNVIDSLVEEQLESLTREQLEEQIKDRVRRQLEERKRRSRKQGAFRKGNNNKTYVKGKRVMTDTGF